MELFEQIRVLNTQQSRFRRLDEQAKELVTIGSSVDEFTYKNVMNGLITLMNAAKSLRSGQAVESFGIRAPVEARKGKVKSNLSRCVRNSGAKKRRLSACRTCTEAGRTEAVGHRANSSKCPLFENGRRSVENESNVQ